MFIPALRSRIEQNRDLAGDRIDAAKIWPLVRIAVIARQSQIAGIIVSAMFSRNDVFEMEYGERQLFLLEMAVFTPIAGALADEVA